MLKKILSGAAALTIAASCMAVTSSAFKLGDVNNDTNIDIEDAVAVINHVNGLASLTEEQEKYADVNSSKNIDIEDAVLIINHINGLSALPDTEVEIDDGKPKTVTIRLKDGRDDLVPEVVLEYGSPIPRKYGKGSEPESWFALEFPNKFMMGEEFTQEIKDIVTYEPETHNEIQLQTLIDNQTPITYDMDFVILFQGSQVPPYGRRTLEVFDEILDNNYKMSFKSAEAYGMMMEVSVEGEVLQKDEKNSELKAKIALMGDPKDSDIFTIDGTKYYVRNAADMTYSVEPTTVESILDMQKIFGQLASDRDNLKFIKQTKDENGDIIETFRTKLDLTEGLSFDKVIFHAYYDKSTKELKRLIVYDEETYDEEDHSFSDLYLDTAELKFEPSFEGEIDAPDFSDGWTVVKAGLF